MGLGIDCPRCGRATNASARFCAACGGALPRSCPACGHRGEAAAHFCSACGTPLDAPAKVPPATAERPVYTPRHLAARILTQRAALEGERKQVTVLFVDLKGSMEIAEGVDPEEWHAIMDRFFALVAEGIHRFEGTVNQYTGDGAMALFGAPLALEDHAERACHAALALAGELAHYGDELKRERGFGFAVRTGINSGEVVVGRIGDDLRMDYTAQGHTVGLASRMEQLAHPGRIYLTEHTAALVEGRFRLRDLGPYNVRGVREPVRVFELEGVGSVRTRLEMSRARGFSRLVGRTGEAAQLASVLERALAGEGAAAAVIGEAGVGKSRLCFELANVARARGVVVREAHALPYGRTVPFLPVLELLRGMLGIAERDGDEEARRKVAGTLLLLDRSLHDVLPLVFEFLGIADPHQPPARAGDPEARQRQLLAIVRRLLVEQASRAPQLLLIEDLHWLDGGSEAFLRALAEALPGTRAMLLVNFRPEYTGDWLPSSCDRIALAPLGAVASAELLVELLGRDPSLGDLAERIGERTAGNPFFIEEMVRALADAGSLLGARGAYRLVAPVTAALPATVQAVLAARIDRLDEQDKGVLQAAAVIGKSFARDVLARVSDLPEAALGRALEALARGEFIRAEAAANANADDESFVFAHPLTHEVAYRSQLGARREQVHASVATVLEEIYAGRADEVAALLAHHHEMAGDRLAAARWSRRAAERAMRSDVAEGVRLWTKARDLVAGLPDTEETGSIAIWSAIQLLNLGWRSGLTEEQARALFESGLEIAKRGEDASAMAGVLVTYSAVRGLAGEAEEALELGAEAMRLARAAGDDGTQLATQAALIQTQIMAGRLRDARREIEPALATSIANPGLGNEQTGFDTHTWFLAMRGELRTATGDLAGAERDLDLALERARSLGEIETLGWSHEMRSDLARWLGDGDGALAHARQGVQIAERMGSAFSQTSSYGTLAQAHQQRAEWAEAEAAFAHVLEIIRTRRSFLHWEAGAVAQLAEIQAVRGEHALALEGARRGVALARRRRTLFIELIASRALVRVLLTIQGGAGRDEILQVLARADELVELTGAVSWTPLLHVERALLARLLDDDTTCRREFEHARAGFLAIGATVRAREAAAGTASRV